MSPKAILPLLSQSAKKSISRLITFYDRSGRQKVKGYGAPALLKEVSLKQWTRRHITGLLTAHWQCMTTVQKAVYDDEAKIKNLSMSGYNYFFKLAMADLPTHHGLHGYWSMNEKPGEQLPDYSGNSNHGTLKPSYPANCPTRVDAMIKQYGNALSFDGIDDYVTSAGWPQTKEITITLWFRTKILDGTRYIINMGGDYGRLEASDKLKFYLWDTAFRTVLSTINLVINRWYHFTGTYKKNDIMQMYLNGIFQNSTPIGVLGGDTDLNIGSRLSPNDRFFNGLIDEIQVYDRVLSSTEILKHYNLLRLDKRRQALLLH